MSNGFLTLLRDFEGFQYFHNIRVHEIFFALMGQYYISLNFGRGVNFYGVIFGIYCIFKIFLENLERG